MLKKRRQNKKDNHQYKETLWQSFSVEKVYKKLKASKDGLTGKEAEKRLKEFGLNKLPEEKPLGWFFILLSQFKNPLIYILLFAGIMSLAMREFMDALIIIAAVFINTVVGFIQEYKANRAITRLRQLVRQKAKVIRDGLEIEVDSSLLVSGDIIVLEAGDKVPADARIIESINLQAVEAALTGESMPSNKSAEILAEGTILADRENMLYMGAYISGGRGRAIVCETGVRTELGKVAKLVNATEDEKTPLQKKLARFSRMLGLLVLGMSLFIFILGIVRGEPAFQMFKTAVAIAVASVPEGLIVAVTVVLAVGMQRILKEKALVRKLVAAETLGSTTVICSDKTGTLTEGKMRVVHLIAGAEEFEEVTYESANGCKLREYANSRRMAGMHEMALEIGLLCNNAVVENPNDELKDLIVFGDTTEVALLLAGIESGMKKDEVLKKNPRFFELPFNEERKFMATWHHRENGGDFVAMKGAPEEVLERSNQAQTSDGAVELTQAMRKKIQARTEELSRQGLRVLGVGYKSKVKSQKSKVYDEEIEKLEIKKLGNANITDKNNWENLNDMVFVGLVGLKDTVRTEAKEAIEICRKAGIRPIIITGDHKLTAQAIGREVGIPSKAENILTGVELDQMNDDDLKHVVKKVDIYARVTPHHKLRIIGALQAQGEVVAMAGDGINDAPAIKKADIGLALGSGTDVAKETADMILLDDNYQTIVKAVEQGRIIFDNIKKIILYLLSDAFSEIVLIGGSLLIGLPLPVTAVQILWINLIADGFPDAALTLEPGEKEAMNEAPSKKNQLLDTEMKVLIFIIGIITDILLFGVYFYLLDQSKDFIHIQTVIFTILAVNSLFYVFSCKSIRHSIFSTRIFSNWWLIGAVIAALGLQIMALYLPFFQRVLNVVPLSAKDWVLVASLGVMNIVGIEVGKWFFIVKRRSEKLRN